MSDSRPTGSGPATPRYAVAICTYNGARYVEAQLTSILAATPACSEVVLIDDASSDETLTIASSTLRDWPGRAVIAVNPVNRGSRRSFERALALTTEPFVFLADQDDHWHRDKPARMLDAFAKRPELLLLHSDAHIVDDALHPLGYGLLRAIEVSAFERHAIHHGDAFDAFVRRNIATGATIAMRRALIDIALPIPDGWVHDEWLATIASAIGTVDFVDAPLIDYRQHANNQIGARKLSLRDKIAKSFEEPGAYYENQLTRATALLERLIVLGSAVPPDRIAKVRDKIRHLRIRADLPKSRLGRLVPIVGEWKAGSYRRYSSGLKSVVRDLLHDV